MTKRRTLKSQLTKAKAELAATKEELAKAEFRIKLMENRLPSINIKQQTEELKKLVCSKVIPLSAVGLSSEALRKEIRYVEEEIVYEFSKNLDVFIAWRQSIQEDGIHIDGTIKLASIYGSRMDGNFAHLYFGEESRSRVSRSVRFLHRAITEASRLHPDGFFTGEEFKQCLSQIENITD